MLATFFKPLDHPKNLSIDSAQQWRCVDNNQGASIVIIGCQQLLLKSPQTHILCDGFSRRILMRKPQSTPLSISLSPLVRCQFLRSYMQVFYFPILNCWVKYIHSTLISSNNSNIFGCYWRLTVKLEKFVKVQASIISFDTRNDMTAFTHFNPMFGILFQFDQKFLIF